MLPNVCRGSPHEARHLRVHADPDRRLHRRLRGARDGCDLPRRLARARRFASPTTPTSSSVRTPSTTRAATFTLLVALFGADERRDGPRPHLPRLSSTVVAGHRLDRSTVPLLLTLGLGVFAGALDLGVLSPALPALGAQFGVGARELPWVFTLYLLANVVAIPVMSKLADRNGRRPIYIACMTIFALGSVIAIVSPNFPTFLVARAIQAIGAGGIFPVATAAIADRVPADRRGAALGLVAATWGLAAVIGPNLGGILTHLLSWHWIFVANVPLAIVVIALARTTVPATAANVRGPLDVPGIVLLAAGLVGLMLGSHAVRRDRRDEQPAAASAAGRRDRVLGPVRRGRTPRARTGDPTAVLRRSAARARLRPRDPHRDPRRRAVLYPRGARRRAASQRGRGRRYRRDRRVHVRRR